MYIGVDIGGTAIKFGVVDSKGSVLKKQKIKTADTTETIVSEIVKACKSLMSEFEITKVGVACPGYIIDGVIQNPSNLPFYKTPLKSLLAEALNLPVSVENDAQCAGLAEAKRGAGSGISNVLMITLGTGIGGAIIIDGKLFKGINGGAGEVGHITLDRNGAPCNCGRRGCFEHFASVTALINQTKKAVEENPYSILATVANASDCINGKTVFDAMDRGCSVAHEVYDNYISYLSEGIDSAQMLLQPDVVLIGGAISSEGGRLLEPLKQKLKTNATVKVANLGGDAGIIGAAMLCVPEIKE